MRISLVILLSFLLSIGYAQDRQIIDSLKQTLANATHDTSRVLLMCQISSTYRVGDADSTIFYGNKALELANKSNFLRGKIQAMLSLSNGYQNSGYLPKALEILLKALKIAENNFFREEENRAANGLGNVYNELGDFSKALIYFKRVIQILEETNQTSVFTYCSGFMNIGTQFEGLNQLDSAEYYFQKSLQAFKKNNINASPQLYRHLGNVQLTLGNMPLALGYYQKSLQTKTIENFPTFYSNTLNALSLYYQKANKPDSSLYYANQALIQARLISSKNRFIIDAAMQLSTLYETINTDEAFRYYKMAVETRDSLYGKNSLDAIQAIADQEEEQQREMEANQIRYQNQLKQYALLAGLGVLLLLALFLYLNNKKEKKAKILLQEKNQVIEQTLTNLKSTQSQLIQSEKMASLGELTAGIAHEIQNPLNFVNNFSEVSAELVEEVEEERAKSREARDETLVSEILGDIKQNLEKITLHGKRADAIVKGMLEHSKRGSGQREPTDLNALADDFLRMTYQSFLAKDPNFKVELQTNLDPDLPKVSVIPQDIGKVLLNLYSNAFYACAERSRSFGTSSRHGGQAFDVQHSKFDIEYSPKVTVSTKTLSDKIEISVKDNGPGIPSPIKDKIFQPFFTTKPTGSGTGLGLSLSYDIVKAHRGELKVETKEGEGTEFIIKLPIS